MAKTISIKTAIKKVNGFGHYPKIHISCKHCFTKDTFRIDSLEFLLQAYFDKIGDYDEIAVCRHCNNKSMMFRIMGIEVDNRRVIN